MMSSLFSWQLRGSVRSALILALVALLLTGLGMRVMAALPPIVDGQALPSLAPMVKRTSQSVVNIATYAEVRHSSPLLRDPFFRRFFDLPSPRARKQSRSAGSGVILDAANGVIVTNFHVIEGADAIEVTLQDGRGFRADLLGSDPLVDLALLRIEADGLSAISLAAQEPLQVGDFVVAIGNPFGLGQTVTSGIVSALGRSGLGILGYEDFIQTDASINPGNSGGALVNLRGELVGINSAILAPAGGNVGIGFAIPTPIVQRVWQQISEHGEVRRGVLGISYQDLTPQLVEAFGLKSGRGILVTQVLSGSAAERAGLKEGDVLLALNGRPVTDGAGFRNQMGLLIAGEAVQLNLWRQGRQVQIGVNLDAMNPDRVTGRSLARQLDGVELETFREEGKALAVRIVRLQNDSLAYRSGLRPGDLIIAANRFRVSDVESLQKALGLSRAVVLQILRGDATFYIQIR